MRILHLHDSPNIPGGATGYLCELAREMNRRGHTNHFFSIEEPALGLPGGAAFHAYPWPNSALRRRLDFHVQHAPLRGALAQTVRFFVPDVIHLQNWPTFRSTVYPTLARLGVPVIQTVHDYSLLNPNPMDLPRAGIRGWTQKLMDAASLRRDRKLVFTVVQRFLLPSKALAAGVGFPVDRSEVIRPPMQALPILPPAPSPPRLLFLGSLYPSKGPDRAIQALTHLPPQVQLDIAGEGPERNNLERLCQSHNLGTRVHFHGHISPAQRDDLLAQATLVVLPSRITENTPFALLESGAQGRAVVGPNSGGIPELLGNSERGWTFQADSLEDFVRAVREGLESESTRTARASALHQFITQECSPMKHWDRMEAVYAEVSP
ncbi:MAG: glycosyltransferase family 4 protein [Planctomycetes bacterium]|nr:glycosyltransferase family 4 protein [Planctomycetota bacterium]